MVDRFLSIVGGAYPFEGRPFFCVELAGERRLQQEDARFRGWSEHVELRLHFDFIYECYATRIAGQTVEEMEE